MHVSFRIANSQKICSSSCNKLEPDNFDALKDTETVRLSLPCRWPWFSSWKKSSPNVFFFLEQLFGFDAVELTVGVSTSVKVDRGVSALIKAVLASFFFSSGGKCKFLI